MGCGWPLLRKGRSYPCCSASQRDEAHHDPQRGTLPPHHHRGAFQTCQASGSLGVAQPGCTSDVFLCPALLSPGKAQPHGVLQSWGPSLGAACPVWYRWASASSVCTLCQQQLHGQLLRASFTSKAMVCTALPRISYASLRGGLHLPSTVGPLTRFLQQAHTLQALQPAEPHPGEAAQTSTPGTHGVNPECPRLSSLWPPFIPPGVVLTPGFGEQDTALTSVPTKLHPILSPVCSFITSVALPYPLH